MAPLLYSFQRCFAKLSASDIDKNEAVGNTDLQRKIQWFRSDSAMFRGFESLGEEDELVFASEDGYGSIPMKIPF